MKRFLHDNKYLRLQSYYDEKFKVQMARVQTSPICNNCNGIHNSNPLTKLTRGDPRPANLLSNKIRTCWGRTAPKNAVNRL